MAPIFNFHFYEGSSSTEPRGRVLDSARELQVLTDRRRSRSRRRRRDAPPERWIGSTARSPQPLTDVSVRVESPQPPAFSASSVYQSSPEQWLGANFQTTSQSTLALAIQGSPPGDLRSYSTQDQQPPSSTPCTHSQPLPPPTSPPPDNTHTAPPPPPPPLPPRVTEPLLSPFRPTVGGIAGFLQHARHASVPPPSSLTPTSSAQVLDDLNYNKKGEPKNYPAQDPGEDDLAYSNTSRNLLSF